MLPNFIIAGGVASGTSFLSAMLAHHPEVYLPRIQRPEPNFFHYSWKFDLGLEWYQNTWFTEAGSQRAIGERSSLLLTSDVAAKRIRQSLPDIKIIFCLRNPIERAWANYRFSVLEGLEPLSFDEAIECESLRMRQAVGKWAEVQPHAYLTRSKYSAHLQEYLELFDREQILLLKSEDMSKHPHDTLGRVCEFLDISPSIQLPLPPNYSSPSVIDRQLQVALRKKLGDKFSEIIELIRKEDSPSTEAGSEEFARHIELLRVNLESGKAKIPESSRQRLHSLLDEEIARTRKLVDFSVDDWT